MIGNKIRAYREFKGMNQVQLAEAACINVGTIRKYELGLRNPKPEQLTKIASALGLNVSVFLDFNIETIGDVLSLLFAIDDAVDLSLSATPPTDNKDNNVESIGLSFHNPALQKAVMEWCEFKTVYEKEKREILSIEDEDKRQSELERLESIQEEWKLRSMGTTVGCHRVVKKGTEGNVVKLLDLT